MILIFRHIKVVDKFRGVIFRSSTAYGTLVQCPKCCCWFFIWSPALPDHTDRYSVYFISCIVFREEAHFVCPYRFRNVIHVFLWMSSIYAALLRNRSLSLSGRSCVSNIKKYLKFRFRKVQAFFCFRIMFRCWCLREISVVWVTEKSIRRSFSFAHLHALDENLENICTYQNFMLRFYTKKLLLDRTSR